MSRPIRTKPVSGARVRTYAGKAEEYADVAASEIEAAATSQRPAWRSTLASMPPTPSVALALVNERRARTTIKA